MKIKPYIPSRFLSEKIIHHRPRRGGDFHHKLIECGVLRSEASLGIFCAFFVTQSRHRDEEPRDPQLFIADNRSRAACHP
jgi:hypothetical protein